MPTLSDLGPLALDLGLLGALLLVFAVDLVLPHGRKRVLGLLTAALLTALFAASFTTSTAGSAFGGAYVGSEWALLFKRIALAAGALATLGALDHVDRHFPTRQGEFFLLLLFSLLGMTLLPGARDLLLLVVCFELMGIPLAMLASFAKADDTTGTHRHAAEAGLKLYLVSAVSTAITLFGLSYVYGLTGSTRIATIAAAPVTPLLGLGMMFTVAGMAFKIGAVPFHMWVPDTYQGAPVPFVAFLSVAPKATGLAAIGLLLSVAFREQRGPLLGVMLFFVVASVVAGSLLALPQRDVRRLLAYSGIAQIGYMLMGFAAGTVRGTAMLLFYVAGYAATNLGAFLVLEAVTPGRPGPTLEDLRGLSRRSPWLALALLVFLLSLAGIPFVVGFWAKLSVFLAAYQAGLGWLVLFGALMAIVSLWYYLQVAKAAYLDDPPPEERAPPPAVGAPLALAIWICLALVVGMGAYPRPFLESAATAAQSLAGH
ncbi:MAG: NADH-quinone oxidoreductase subunit N [Polyangiaceae bacterium]|nr:NADH-quinone oxidoreductase subunit N [Polyangiaceae bacterium]